MAALEITTQRWRMCARRAVSRALAIARRDTTAHTPQRRSMTTTDFPVSMDLWVALGSLGQAVFSGRFLLQWWHSERQKRSAMPMGFWYASVAGAVLLLAFAVYKRDPVFVAGYLGGLLIYLRNLQLRLREARQCRARGHD